MPAWIVDELTQGLKKRLRPDVINSAGIAPARRDIGRCAGVGAARRGRWPSTGCRKVRATGPLIRIGASDTSGSLAVAGATPHSAARDHQVGNPQGFKWI